MSELQPLDIVDDRTLEQIRESGDERWPDGRPYIVRGVCCACGQPADEQHVCLIKLNKLQACGLCLQATGKWVVSAWWVLNHTSACDACIQAMADMNSDNEQWLRPALADIKARQPRLGARVRILAAGEMMGQQGIIYNHLPDRPAPWHVRPEGWREDRAGIAYKANELEVIL